MRVVRLTDAVCAQLAERAAAASPREFVALLGGRRASRKAPDSPDGPDGYDEVTAVRTLSNEADRWSAAGSGSDSFLVDPTAFARAEAELRDEGLAFVGFAHSHPGGVAAPSVRDHVELWPGVVQLIVGCTLHGQHPTIRAFQREGRHKLEPMAIAASARQSNLAAATMPAANTSAETATATKAAP